MPGQPGTVPGIPVPQTAVPPVRPLPSPSKEEQPQSEVVASTSYPNEAADYFGELFAHRLRWAHAVNSQRMLSTALVSNSHFLEADVSAGPLVEQKPDLAKGAGGSGGSRVAVTETSVMTSAGLPVIMAHYPTQRSSDLCFELFIGAVLKHNAQIDGEEDEPAEASTEIPEDPSQEDAEDQGPVRRPQRSPFSAPVLHDHLLEDAPERSSSTTALEASSLVRHGTSAGQEAAAFAVDLHRELETLDHNQMMMACIGARRGGSRLVRHTSKKGVKLDFKVFECVEPALRHLQSIDAAKKLGGHLWLNADVFAGPGYPERFLSPIDARRFVQLCAELVPDAVLSLSWGSSILSASRHYTMDMVNRMIELCMSPIVPRSMLSPTSRAEDLVAEQEIAAEPIKQEQ
ncbi:FAM151A, partial [Symbiodinium necroappetens]